MFGWGHFAQTPPIDIEYSRNISDSLILIVGRRFPAHKHPKLFGERFDLFSLLHHGQGETLLVGLGYFSTQFSRQSIQLSCVSFNLGLPQLLGRGRSRVLCLWVRHWGLR